MQLMRWRSRPTNPFNLFGLQEEINRMFEEFSGAIGQREGGEQAITPALDIKEDDKYLTVTADLPGVEGKDVEVAVQDNVLTIKGEKRSERHEKQDSYRCVERMFGSFERRVTLPAEVDSEQAEASMENGVLMLRLPKRESTRTKTIPIKSGSRSQSEVGMSGSKSEQQPSMSTGSQSGQSGSGGSSSQSGQSYAAGSQSGQSGMSSSQSAQSSMSGSQSGQSGMSSYDEMSGQSQASEMSGQSQASEMSGQSLMGETLGEMSSPSAETGEEMSGRSSTEKSARPRRR